jgi:hypothetical protein
VPPAPPQTISDDLRALVKGVAGTVPQIATLLGIEPPPPGSRATRSPRVPRRTPRPKPRPAPREAPADAPAEETSTEAAGEGEGAIDDGSRAD